MSITLITCEHEYGGGKYYRTLPIAQVVVIKLANYVYRQ